MTCALALLPNAQAEPLVDFASYDGATVSRIEVIGLKNADENAVTFLLPVKVGQAFSAAEWEIGIRNLYNTLIFFNIQTEIKSIDTPPDPPKRIEIILSLSEKWALMPVIRTDGGGGSTTIEIGVRHANLGGYFTRAILTLNSFNGNLGYRIKAIQDWFLDTELLFGFEISKLSYPVIQEDQAGTPVQQFTWSRNLQQVTFGRRFGQQIRLFSLFETFQDSVLSGTPSLVYPQIQYSLNPTLILGRVNHGDYLEWGNELTLTPHLSNFLDSGSSYHQLTLKFKKIFVLPNETTLAFLLRGGAMTSTLLPYQFRLGGLDGVRGFATHRMIGPSFVSMNLEYRPILALHHFDAVGLVTLQGCLFFDSGWVGSPPNPTPVQSLSLTSAGVGFRIIVRKFASSMVRFDLAQTLAPSEGLGFAFGLGQFF